MKNKGIIKQRARRSTIWTREIKERFRHFVEEFADIINSRANNNTAIKLKQEAWKKIGRNMASIGYLVDEKRMREAWVRMKMQARTSVPEYNAVGRGIHVPFAPEEFHYQVLQTDQANVMEECASCDGDVEAKASVLLSTPKKEIIEEVVPEDDNNIPVEVTPTTACSRVKLSNFTQRDDEQLIRFEDDYSSARKIKSVQLKIEQTKLQVEIKRLEALNQEIEFKQRILQASLEAEQAKKSYYEYKMLLEKN